MNLDGAFEPQEQQYPGSPDEKARATCPDCARAQLKAYCVGAADDRINSARCTLHSKP